MELEEDQDDRLDMLQESKAEENGESTGEEDLPGPESRKDSTDDTMDKEIREHADEEYSWEEFFENNEGSSSTTQYWDEEDGREAPTPATVTFRERISEQIQMLDFSETEEMFADAILWNIDDDGYLHADFEELVRDFNP